MKIQSKKTGEFQDITKAEWEFMKSRGYHRKYDIVDDREYSSEPEKIEAFEIKPIGENDDMADGAPTEEDLIREELDDLGVPYHPRTGLEKLKAKLKEARDGRETGDD